MTDADKARFLEGYLASKREAEQLKEISAKLMDAQEKLLSFGAEIEAGKQAGLMLLARYAKRLDARVEEMRRLEQAIAGVQNDTQRKALELRCFEGRTWEDIADKMGYSLPSMYRIRRAALAAVQL